MTVNSTRAQLHALTRQLASQWQQTHEHWRDARGEEFHRHYMTELDSVMNGMIARTEDLAKIISKIRTDCE